MAGSPKFAASQDLPDFDYARYADSLGLKGIRVDRPDDVGRVWDEALAADRPCIIDAITDPDVPPLPPHISLADAAKFTSTLIKDDPNEVGIIRQAARELAESVLPHRK
jgi:pyruvate dehydrogenase (quinone)